MLIKLIPHDPDWKKSFVLLRSMLLSQLSATHLDIQHVGSTAIPGAPAKPILDIDIVIDHPEQFPEVETALIALGYVSRGVQAWTAQLIRVPRRHLS